MALVNSALDFGVNITWLAREFGEMDMRRATKVTWWQDRKLIGIGWFMTLPFCLRASLCPSVRQCARVSVRVYVYSVHRCVSVSVSAWLTRMHSQECVIILYKGPGTSEARPCGNSSNVNRNCDAWIKVGWWRDNIHLWQCDDRLLALRPNSTPSKGGYRGLVFTSWQLSLIAYDMLLSINFPNQCYEDKQIECAFPYAHWYAYMFATVPA